MTSAAHPNKKSKTFYKFCLVLLIYFITLSYWFNSWSIPDYQVRGLKKLILTNFREQKQNPEIYTAEQIAKVYQESDKPYKNSNQNTDQKKILIIAQYRGGSSFTSEIFNKNPFGVYHFEPFIYSRNNENNNQVKLLQDIFNNCKNPDVNYYLNDDYLQKPDNQNFLTTYNWCKKDNIYFREHIDFAKRWPFCPELEEKNNQLMVTPPELGFTNIPKFRKYCSDPINSEIYHDFCLSRKFIAAKIIRLANFKVIEDYLSETTTNTNNDDQNFFIIYLFRDPRAIFHSRMDLNQNNFDKDQLEKGIIGSCDRFLKLFKSEFFKNQVSNQQIIYLRYEDLALNSDHYLKKIYQKLGISSGLDYVRQVLYKETHPDSIKQNFLANTNQNKAYNIIRDPYISVNKWKKNLNFTIVERIQKTCGKDLFDKLGYPFYEDVGQIDDGLQENDAKNIVRERWFYDFDNRVIDRDFFVSF